MAPTAKTLETFPRLDARAADHLLGITVGDRYLIEKELGHGGVGVVYLARDHKLHDKPVVVKVLLEKSLRDDWVVLKFKQEMEALARVDHPGVVGILDSGEFPDGKPYLVMQYVEGIALRDVIHPKPEGLDMVRVASIIKQIGAALSAVHQKKICHRDLKPENIMLQALDSGDEQVKIVDFGIAKIKESVIAPSTVTGAATAGTIVYMSPEQLRGSKITVASDIYSLGVIAYEMVTGRRPFNPATTAHLAEMQREGVRVRPADLRPRLPEEAQAIILKALAFEPADRVQSAAEFGESLSRALLNEEETVKQRRRVEPLPTQLSVLPQAADQTAKTVITPIQSAHVIAHNVSFPVPYRHEVERKLWPKLVVGLALVVLVVGAFVAIINRQSLFGSAVKPTPVPEAQRSLSYSLTVQKMRDGKPYKEPFESSGQEIFESGYKFRLNVSSPEAGYLYVFNEGADEQDGFTIIYPTPVTNNGSAKLDANPTVRTSWNRFEGEAGTEQFWMVWAASPVTQLEVAKDAAFKDKEGAITAAATRRSLKDFLTKHSEPKPRTTKNTDKQQTEVRATGDVLVKLVELEHR